MIIKKQFDIPFLVDVATKTAYAYEKHPTQPLLALGTYDPVTETIQLYSNWKELYEPKLQAHRNTERPRSRLPQAAQATQ